MPASTVTPAKIIDLDSLPDQQSAPDICKEISASQSSKQTCPGIHIPFPAGTNPYTSYPFGLHQMHRLPWDIYIVGQKMTIQSIHCRRTTELEDGTCAACKSLHTHGILEGIQSRIECGIHKNTLLLYQPIAGQVEINCWKTNQLDVMRFCRLTDSRKLVGRAATLEDYKKFVMAVGEGGVNRVDALVRAGLKNKAGIKGLLQLLDKAIRGVYKPKNFMEEEMLHGIVFLKLGGARIAEIAHRSLSTPGVSTLRRHTGTRPLRPSPSTPSLMEISHNIEVSFNQSGGTDGKTLTNTGYVLMFDKLKVEQRPRWDDRTNKLVGICREHSHNLGLEFCTIHEVEALLDAITRREVHLATEVCDRHIIICGCNPYSI
jgi:hypothetical protein